MMPPSTQHKQEFSAICQTRALSQLLTAETADLLLLGRCFLFVPLTSDPANLHAGHSGRGWVGGGWGWQDNGISQEHPQLPQSLREAFGPDYNLPDASCICCHEIIHLADAPKV